MAVAAAAWLVLVLSGALPSPSACQNRKVSAALGRGPCMCVMLGG